MKLAVAGPREAGRRASFLLDRTGETVTTCDRLEVFCVLSFFFPKGFCWGSNFVFTTSGFPLLLQSGSHTYLGFRMLFILFGGGGDARERLEDSLVGLLSLCSCSLFKGGAKNLTVKSILWRGSAYRFLPCPFTVKLKNDPKKLEEEGHAFLSEEVLGLERG
jgi:hypothetical protein